jgi:hypothetical protein
MKLTHNQYIDKKVASALIYNSVANFDLSAIPHRIPDAKIKYLRLGLLCVVLASFVMHLVSQKLAFLQSIFTSLEDYASFACVLALYLSHKATAIKNRAEPSGKEIVNKRQALIWNEIAITLNVLVVSLFFVLIPITLAFDGKMTFGYYLTV